MSREDVDAALGEDKAKLEKDQKLSGEMRSKVFEDMRKTT